MKELVVEEGTPYACNLHLQVCPQGAGIVTYALLGQDLPEITIYFIPSRVFSCELVVLQLDWPPSARLRLQRMCCRPLSCSDSLDGTATPSQLE